MSSRRRPILFRLTRYLVNAAGILMLVAVAYVLIMAYLIRSVCVQLPNGLVLGYEALVDPDRPYWGPNVILKYADGTPVFSDWVEDFYFTETTVWGGTLNAFLNGLGGGGRKHPAYREDVYFAYRPDVGLVYRHEGPDTYETLKEEAGPIIWVMGQEVHTNLLGTFLELKKDPASRRTFCPLRVLPGRRRGAE